MRYIHQIPIAKHKQQSSKYKWITSQK